MDVCSICLDTIDENDHIFQTECSHFYHYECIKKWLYKDHSCPICRTPLPSLTMWQKFKMMVADKLYKFSQCMSFLFK